MGVRISNQLFVLSHLRGFCSRLSLRRLVGMALVGMSSALIGCTSLSNIQESLRYNESWNDWVVSQRNAAWAARAWHLRKHHFCKEKYLDDFCAGFRAGYVDVASGSNGCTPAFPPQEYWGWKYQSAEGQGRVAAWFSGYPHGARAAEEDGVGHFTQIQMSSGIYNEYSQGEAGSVSSHMYPMPENVPSYGQVPADGSQVDLEPTKEIPGTNVGESIVEPVNRLP